MFDRNIIKIIPQRKLCRNCIIEAYIHENSEKLEKNTCCDILRNTFLEILKDFQRYEI